MAPKLGLDVIENCCCRTRRRVKVQGPIHRSKGLIIKLPTSILAAFTLVACPLLMGWNAEKAIGGALALWTKIASKISPGGFCSSKTLWSILILCLYLFISCAFVVNISNDFAVFVVWQGWSIAVCYDLHSCSFGPRAPISGLKSKQRLPKAPDSVHSSLKLSIYSPALHNHSQRAHAMCN